MVLSAFGSLQAHIIGNDAICRSFQQYARPSEAVAIAAKLPWPAHAFTPLEHNVEFHEMVLSAFGSLQAHIIGNAAICRSFQQYSRPSEAIA